MDGRIVADPEVMLGKHVVRGTRITIENILDRLSAGEKIDQVLEAHPRLSRDSIRSTLASAAAVFRSDITYSLQDESA